MPKVEEMRMGWFDAPDLGAQQRIAREIQAEAFREVPYLPLGSYFQPWSYRTNVTNVLGGMPLFWNVRKG
jgi:peptide/nickel transport system substrate-binding protein